MLTERCLASATCLFPSDAQGEDEAAREAYRLAAHRCAHASPAEQLRASIGEATCAARAGDAEAASAAFGAALRLDPGNSPLRYNRAVLCMRLEQWTTAAADLAQLVKTDERLRPQALHALAVLCASLGFRTRAEQAARR